MSINFRRLALISILAIGSSITSGIFAQPKNTEVLKVMELANDYFINKYPDAGAPTFVKKERPSNLWTRGVYFEGLWALTEMERLTGGEKYDVYYKYISDWGNAHKWTPRNGVTTRDADDYCCSQTYIDMGHVIPTKKCLDNIINANNTPWAPGGNMKSKGSYGDWTWIDAIQMGLPVFSKMSAVKLLQDDPDAMRYAEKGWQMYKYSRDSIAGGLFNKKEGLWWRDADFVPPYKEPNGRNCYWSRGNGWVYAALVRAMESLPSDPHYKEYKKDFISMSKALVKCQRADRYWNVSLHDESNYGGKEMSGTALFIYGMAWGVNNGILSASKYKPIIYDTWNAIVKDCVHKNGFLGYVQGTGKEPKDSQPVTYDKQPDFDDYGLGCLLLAGCEIMKMEK
ncbi:MAG: glycoside hydrolase family 88 protein [Bacteroidaceae bacterium]|nr:glycoside hydrolase family 88 protein [Bacteroidaceae bacterium]